MASSPDVFICFNKDTGENFASHLCASLRRKGLKTFKRHDLEAESSEIITKAIEESTVSVAIISKNFGGSSRCLDELAKILECRKMMGQIVIPVYYHVDSTVVRNQTGSFGAAFNSYIRRITTEEIQCWKNALREVTNLRGLSSSAIRPEAMLVDKIVQDIDYKLRPSRRKAAFERAFVLVNFILELPSAVFDQLSSLQKPMYALVSMLISAVSLLVCLIDLIINGRE